jgi:hypothetical protein
LLVEIRIATQGVDAQRFLTESHCVTQFSVTKYQRKTISKKAKFLSAYGFRGFSPRSLDPVAFWPVSRQSIMVGSCEAGDVCSPQGSQEAKREEEADDTISLTGEMWLEQL